MHPLNCYKYKFFLASLVICLISWDKEGTTAKGKKETRQRQKTSFSKVMNIIGGVEYDILSVVLHSDVAETEICA